MKKLRQVKKSFSNKYFFFPEKNGGLGMARVEVSKLSPKDIETVVKESGQECVLEKNEKGLFLDCKEKKKMLCCVNNSK